MPRVLATARQIATNRILATGRVPAVNRIIPSTLLFSLVAYWKLEEASGMRADVTERGNNLTDNNTVTGNPGRVGNAAQFTRVNSESLSIADNAALSTGDIDLAIAVWVYMDSKPGTNIYIFNKGSSATTGAFEYRLLWVQASDRFRFVCGDATHTGTVDASALGAPSLATWYFIVCWHDAAANTVNIQVNGGTVNSTAYTFGMADTATSFFLGQAGDSSQYWNGRIDEVGIWKRVLTAAERTALYNGGLGQTHPFPGT